jgi:hypothetical protein
MTSRFGDAPGGSKWNLSYEVDFAAAPTQALNIDGVYAIGGRNWTVENSANTFVGHPGMRIVNGTGLYLPSESDPAMQYWPQFRGEPMIGAALDGDLENDTPMMCQVHMGPNSLQGCELYFGFEYPSPLTMNVGIRLNIDGNDTVFNGWGMWNMLSPTYRDVIHNSTKRVVGNNIGQLKCPLGVLPGGPLWMLSGIDADGDWLIPERLATLFKYHWIYYEDPGGDVTRATTDPRNWRFFLSCHFAAVHQTYEQVVRKIAVYRFG